jgi:methionyl-tRNA formyltransferase
VLAASGNQLIVSTGEGALQLHRLQPSGKRVLAADEFLRGYPVQPGDRLAAEEAPT